MFKYVSDVSILSHNIIKEYIPEKDVAIDATLGNGYDCDFLSENFKKVYAFEIQKDACDKYIDKNNNVIVINESHDNDVEVLEELVDLPNENNDIHIPKTIAELNEAIKNKDEKAIDKALETFAINEKTGVIDLNKAISIVTNNAVNEAVKCIMNETDFDKDMSKYDITGRKVA